MFVVGDLGSLVKNAWRALPYTEGEVAKLEVFLTGLGLLTELAPGVGEAADAPISLGRAIVAAVGKGDFVEVIFTFIKKGLENTTDLAGAITHLQDLGKFMYSWLFSDDVFQSVRTLLTNSSAFLGAFAFFRKAPNMAPDKWEQVWKTLGDIGNASEAGLKRAQDIWGLIGNLNGTAAAFTFLRTSSPSNISNALTHIDTIMRNGVDPSLLKAILNNDELFTLATKLTPDSPLADLAVVSVSNPQGLGSLATNIPIWTSGRLASPSENAFKHFTDHGADFAAPNPIEYLVKAREFLQSPPSSTLSRVRANGDVVRFDPVTDTFGVMDATGAPKTFYKPDPAIHGRPTNLDYFNEQ